MKETTQCHNNICDLFTGAKCNQNNGTNCYFFVIRSERGKPKIMKKNQKLSTILNNFKCLLYEYRKVISKESTLSNKIICQFMNFIFELNT